MCVRVLLCDVVCVRARVLVWLCVCIGAVRVLVVCLRVFVSVCVFACV